eukprot:914104-Prymnesium_polylepis.1
MMILADLHEDCKVEVVVVGHDQMFGHVGLEANQLEEDLEICPKLKQIGWVLLVCCYKKAGEPPGQ